MRAIFFPGQGAQFKGMGKQLFPRFRELTAQASDILGYSLERLCLEDADDRLRSTQFTQPALYAVNALAYRKYLEDGNPEPEFLVGHSLGEYNALLAAGAFDFETGLRIVQRRGELMGQVQGGGMAAVVGCDRTRLEALLRELGLIEIDMANFNSPTQTVISGPGAIVDKAITLLDERQVRCVALNVSGAFHSRYMAHAQAAFASFVDPQPFRAPRIRVIANATARPYAADEIATTLTAQLASPVRWHESVAHLLAAGCTEFTEIGGNFLTKMINDIRVATPVAPTSVAAPMVSRTSTGSNASGRISAATLGSARFRRRFGLRYAYLAGAMYRGIASPKMVVRLAKAGCLGFFGAGGLSPADTAKGISFLRAELRDGQPFGVNLLANYADPLYEMAAVDILIRHGVRFVEAAAFTQMTPAIVYFRLRGLSRAADGTVHSSHRVVAKVSHPEVAEAFMSPAPREIVEQLLCEGRVTPEQAELARRVPVSEDVCIEADSGGHTDGGIPTVLFPAMLQLKRVLERKFAYAEPICMGLAGGIGTPEAAAAAFVMGADFILTGSINQCTVDAGTSDDVKAMLQDINVQDTQYAPAGDMFEVGSRVQVLKKGVFFPMRANKLYSLYSHYGSLEEIPEKIREQLEVTYFKRSFAEIYEDTKAYLQRNGSVHEIARAELNAKHKMALVFRWYFAHTSKLALTGVQAERVNYQVHTGPALGAFNQWVKDTPLESWTRRHADEIAHKLLEATADCLNVGFSRLTQSVLA